MERQLVVLIATPGLAKDERIKRLQRLASIYRSIIEAHLNDHFPNEGSETVHGVAILQYGGQYEDILTEIDNERRAMSILFICYIVCFMK